MMRAPPAAAVMWRRYLRRKTRSVGEDTPSTRRGKWSPPPTDTPVISKVYYLSKQVHSRTKKLHLCAELECFDAGSIPGLFDSSTSFLLTARSQQKVLIC